ncbi:YfcE family phosphodiesterase [Candidatus Woesearchaeota archaeon]|nr:YfcE family phosphodiesterase [Candidatus Woesearchaeota archaeon]
MIGIISDTHDNIINIKKAVEIFKKNKVDFVIHAGDVVAPATVKFFEGLSMKFVFGNCDGDRAVIEEKCKEFGFEHHGRIMELKVKGKTIGVFHGDDILINHKMLDKGYDFFIHGHTHVPEDRMAGKDSKTRILCPGGHYLGDPKEYQKVIILNLDNNKALFLDV